MMRQRKPPLWLEPLWRTKREATAMRIITAIESLQKRSTIVSLSAICSEVGKLTGGSLSPNSIKRNPAAYDAYLAARPPSRSQPSYSSPLIRLTAELHGAQRSAMYARIARLRRENKDSLIARIVDLDRQCAQQEMVERRLRDQILTLSLVPATVSP